MVPSILSLLVVLAVSPLLINCLEFNKLSGVLVRDKRGFNGNQVGGFNNGFNGFNSGFNNNNNNNNGFGNQFGLNLPLQSGFNGQSEGQRIRESMDIDIERPRVNVNKNTGATSSSSITNAALVNRGKGGPNLKLGQGLGVAISIQGPEGPATNSTFANTAKFNFDDNDTGNTFANAGDAGGGVSGAQTGSLINIHNNRGGLGTATSFNQANVNMFNANGQRGNGMRFGNAGAASNVGNKK
ncbi:hypothetical protein RvY_04623-1 [Ramazzottius varieornatus]|uniref:Attacin C-terminal domain-containing protein n=1 Tax=Ramazzottius varieornatus TaxID=947166 RepID=A0A1D1US90_RAMVA|nr:hypothetical protein RvY_04623-1 [Ramazzottius varieornatus]